MKNTPPFSKSTFRQKGSSLFLLFLVLFQIFFTLPVLADSNINNPGTSSDVYIKVKENIIFIGNRFIEIAITLGNNTGGGIYSIKDKVRGVDFVRKKESVDIGLFALEYWYEPINWYAALLGRKADIRYRYVINNTGILLSLSWRDLTSTHEDRRFNVNVNVSVYVPSNSNLTYWFLEFTNNDNVIIENVHFPIIPGIDQISDEKDGDYLVVPSWSGILLKNPARNLKEGKAYSTPYYPSGFLNMQFVAYYASNPKSGLYLGDYDATGTYVKKFTFSRTSDGNSAWLINTHVLSFENQVKVALPYSVVIGIFYGDWYDASQIYKEWASKQWWASRTLSKNKDTPSWLKKSGPVIDFFTRYWGRFSSGWNGPYYNLPPTVEAFKNFYNSTPVMWWRGWEKNGFGVSIPDYFPPTEGWDSFDSAIIAAHRKGGRVMTPVPAVNCYSLNASGWQEATKHAPRDRYGNLYTYTWFIHNNSGIVVKQVGIMMAPTDFWMNKILNITLELSTHGMDVIQLDGGPPMPWINYGDKLPKGGGNWWANNFIKIYSAVREGIKKVYPDGSIGSEWMVETYIPFIDIANDEAIGGLDPLGIDFGIFYNASLNTYIPLWHAVYHDRMLLFSSLLLIDGRDFLFYLRGLALSLIWGDIPMIDADPQGSGKPYNLNLYDRRLLEYSRRIVEARTKYAYYYIVEGTMLPQPMFHPNPKIIIPGAEKIPYTGVDVKPFYSDSVFASAWLSPDKSVGIIVTNIGRDTVNTTVSLENYNKLVRENITIYTIVNGEIKQGYFTKELPKELILPLAPYDVALIVLSSADTQRSRALHEILEYENQLRRSMLPESPQANRFFELAIHKFKDNDFIESIKIMEKLNENMTTYKTYIKKIQTLNETINLFSNKSTTIALRKLHQNITNYLNIALQYASTFNFNKSAEMVKKSEEEMTLYLRLINQTLSLLDKIRKLSELVQRINKSTLSEGNKQLLQQAVDMLQEASFKVECGDIEGANNLLKETELLIEKVTSSSEASANSHENYLYILTVILLALSLIVLILKRRKELAGKNSLEQT